jgi:hypothetical protein
MRSVIVVVALASAANAQPDDHARAEELFEEGRRLMTEHDPAAACGKFAESIRLEPLAAGTMLNLGLCHQQLNHYRTALYWFRKAQIRASETDPALPMYEKEARDRTAYLVNVVATIRIELARGTPPDTQVTIDDEAIHPEDFGHLEIDPGHHIVLASSGKLTFRKELDVAGRGGQTVVVGFGTTTTPPEIPPPSIPGDGRRTSSLYVAFGAGALLAGSLGLTLYEKHLYNDNKAAAMAGDAGALDKTRHATEIARDYGSGLAVAGLLAAGAAAYLYFTASETVAPVITPGQAGAVFTRRF